jgi:hypothetical protein
MPTPGSMRNGPPPKVATGRVKFHAVARVEIHQVVETECAELAKSFGPAFDR